MPPSGAAASDSMSILHQAIIHPVDAVDLSEWVVKLQARVKADLTSLGWDAPETSVAAVLEEALFNAWKHGHGQKSDKPIVVRWGVDRDFHLEVIDKGRGFDLCDIPDPTSPENICRPNGRGIFLIRRYSDGVEWDDHGRRIIVTFKRRDPEIANDITTPL